MSTQENDDNVTTSWTRQEWYAMSWRERSSILRSALQKVVGRRAEVDLATSVAALLIEDGRGFSAVRNLLLFCIEDMGSSAMVLLPRLVGRVKAIVKSSKVKATDLPSRNPEICKEIMRLVRWVADPRWKRCRDVPMLANYSLCMIERNLEPPDSVVALFSRLMALDRIWIEDEKLWKQEAQLKLEGFWLEAFKLLPNRLFVVGYYLWKLRFLQTTASDVVVPIPRLSAVPEYTEPCSIPLFPDYVFDKHTVAGRSSGCDMSHFLTVGAAVVNEVKLEHPLVAPLVEQGVALYLDMEKTYGTRGARSSAIRDRVRGKGKKESKRKKKAEAGDGRGKTVQKKKQRTTSEVQRRPIERSLVTFSGSGNKSKQSTAVAKSTVVAKASLVVEGEPKVDLQEKMRRKLEPLMPEEMRGRPWLQKVTSELKRPVIRVDGCVYKGPFDPSWPHRDRVQHRYVALRRLGGGHVPTAQWREINGYWWWVADWCGGLENPFEAKKPLDAIQDDPVFVSELVAAGVAKLALQMGDLCCRNMPWSQQLRTFVLLDLEDENKNLPNVETCSWPEFCFSPPRRMRKEKRAHLEKLMRKYALAIAARLEKMKVHAQVGVELDVVSGVLERVRGHS